MGLKPARVPGAGCCSVDGAQHRADRTRRFRLGLVVRGMERSQMSGLRGCATGASDFVHDVCVGAEVGEHRG